MTTKPWLEAYGDLWQRIQEASPDYHQMAASNARKLGAQLMYGAYYYDAQKIAQFLLDYRIRSVRDPFNYTMEYYNKITAMVADAVDVGSRAIIQNNLSEYNPQEVPPAAVPPPEAPVAEGGVALRPDTRKWTFRR